MKVLIVDDEPLARKRLARLVEEIDECIIVGEAPNGKTALLLFSETNPDIVLLDIRMPEMDGIETASHLTCLPNPPAIIFTTAFDSHALDAFETNAVAYLLKPIRAEKLKNALAKARKLNRAQLSIIDVDQQNKTDSRSHISALVRGNIQLVPITEILYFQADQKYIKVKHIDGELLIEDSLVALEQEFSNLFIRIHRNALVAKGTITGVEKGDDGHHYICIKGSNELLEISRRHLATLRKYLRSIKKLKTLNEVTDFV